MKHKAFNKSLHLIIKIKRTTMATTTNETGARQKFLEHNLSMIDVVLRYAALMIIVMIGGVLHSIPVMLLGLPFFWTAILGWCPVFWLMGINHHTKKNGMI